MDPSESEPVDQPVETTEPPQEEEQSVPTEPEQPVDQPANRFYYLIVDPSDPDNIEAYYVDPTEEESTEAAPEGEFVSAAEEGPGDFIRGIIPGGKTNNRTNVVDTNTNNNRGRINNLPDNDTRGRTNPIGGNRFNIIGDETVGRTNTGTARDNIFNDSSAPPPRPAKPSIFDTLGDRFNDLIGKNKKPPVQLPEMDGTNYAIPPLKETVPAFRFNGDEFPQLSDPRGKYPPEIVEVLEKLTPGFDKINGFPLVPSDQVEAAIKSMGKENYRKNLRAFEQLSMDVVQFREASQKFQTKVRLMEKIIGSAQRFQGKIEISSDGLPGQTSVIKPREGNSLWVVKIAGKHRPVPPFDLEAISPGLARFLGNPDLPVDLHEFLTSDNQLNHDLIKAQIQDEISQTGSSKLGQAYDSHMRYLEVYDQYHDQAVDLSKRIDQMKADFTKFYGNYRPLDVDIQRGLLEKVKSDPRSGLVARGIRIEVDSDVSESTGSGTPDNHYSRMMITGTTDGNPYSPMILS